MIPYVTKEQVLEALQITPHQMTLCIMRSIKREYWFEVNAVEFIGLNEDGVYQYNVQGKLNPGWFRIACKFERDSTHTRWVLFLQTKDGQRERKGEPGPYAKVSIDEPCSMCEWIKSASLHPRYAQERMEGPGHDTHCKRGRS